MPGISIIICCYNSSKRLPKTIEYIAKQEVPNYVPWEVIIVNNNCSDNTVEVALVEWKKYNLNISFQIIDQPIPGLSHARKKGIQFAKYEYLLFCDDDNWLVPNYLQTGWVVMTNNPTIGILGGYGEAVCETKPPDWFEKFSIYYAAASPFPEIKGSISKEVTLIPGAGMIIRKTVYKILYKSGFTPLLSDRKGNSLLSGGDVELCKAIRLAGYKIWFDSRLTFKHFMPKNRLEWAYFKHLCFSMGRSRARHHAYDFALEPTMEVKKNMWIIRVKNHFRPLLESLPYLLFPKVFKLSKVVDAFILWGYMWEMISMRSEFDKHIKYVQSLKLRIHQQHKVSEYVKFN